MHRLQKIVAFVCAVALCFCLPLSAGAEYELPADTEKQLTARSAYLVYMEASATAAEGIGGRDTVLYTKNPDEKLSPATMVRVAVGLYAQKLIQDKNVDMEKATGVYTEVLQNNHIWGTGLSLANMELGETWTVEDLFRLSMIQTAADAAVTLAATLAGGVDAFVVGMNEYVKTLGCTNTTFANVHGLDDPRQKTTARDMYILLRHAMDNPFLAETLSAVECTVKPVKGGEERSWENSNYMLRATSDYYYEPMAAGKTGVSEDSGRALASVAQNDGYSYLAVVMGCPMENEDGETGTHYDNSALLYRWAFNSFSYTTLVKKDQPMSRATVGLSWATDTVTLLAQESLTCVVPEGLDVSSVRTEIKLAEEVFEAPIEKGEVLGHAMLYIREDDKLGEVALVAGESVNRSLLLLLLDRFGKVLSSPWFWGGVALLVLLIIAYVILAILHNREKKRVSRANSRKRKYKPLK